MTRRVCVIGDPVDHSRSPLIHNFWLKEHGIDGEYVRHRVGVSDIDNFLKNFASSGFIGANVTLPHKEAAFRGLAKADYVASALGAANTLWLDGETLCGMNTDVYGFLAHLESSAPGWRSTTKHAVALGAGGAARAAVYGLNDSGVECVTVVNRSIERAQSLASELKLKINVARYADLSALLPEADLLINTTSLGMAGQPPLDVDIKHLKPGAIVYDVVYVPLETELLRQARGRDHIGIDGLGMLLHQAVPGFEKWFGVRPQVTEALRAHLVAGLEASASQ